MITKIEQKNENVLINATKQETKEVNFEIKNKEKMVFDSIDYIDIDVKIKNKWTHAWICGQASIHCEWIGRVG